MQQEPMPSEETPVQPTDLTAALECLLFLAEEPLPEAELARMLEVTPAQARDLVGQLAEQYAGRGLQVVKIAGGWRLCTRPEYAPFIARMTEPERVRLSRAALETLAIIAYRQPITRPEIEAIRGVNCDAVVTTLMNYALIEERGRKEAPGRPMLYGTTKEFLTHFGIDKVEDLPDLPAVEEASALSDLPPAPAASTVSDTRGEDDPTEPVSQ